MLDPVVDASPLLHLLHRLSFGSRFCQFSLPGCLTHPAVHLQQGRDSYQFTASFELPLDRLVAGEAYMAAAVEAEQAGRSYVSIAAEALPEEANPVGLMNQGELEAWWAGNHAG